ncbi:hypothetical protein RRG08_010618 [Elysia crispata]|uniref:Peptidase S1 domain-containing protein n=1 Tax=Elysia crispata TaxID=231223 RepID=A0AAE1AK83_9GAST|nr:hypothetical protein RRG08_010618 [Elysia crispata]
MDHLVMFMLILNFSGALFLSVTPERAMDQKKEAGKKCVPIIRRSVLSLEEYRFMYRGWRMRKLDTCGVQGVDHEHIIHGQAAMRGAWPWQTQVSVAKIICGGVLIHQQWVLTAAHCLDKHRTMTVRISLGLTSPHGARDVTARQTIFHPGYDPNNLYIHDMALLRLWPPTEPNSYVYPACLPPKNASKAYLSGPCYISGVGSTRGDTFVRPDKLQQLRVTTMPLKACAVVKGIPNASGKTFRPDPQRHICLNFNATARSAGICSGDSGGPLSCKYQGHYFLMGVCHYSERGCGKIRFPDIFTKVTFYRDWIDKTINKFSL